MSPAQKPTVEGRQLVRAMWRLIRPYWTSPEAKVSLLLLGISIALQFGGVYASVLISDSQRDIGNALGARDLPGFKRGIVYMIAFMLLGVVVPSYREWVTQRIRVRWRRWFTGHYTIRAGSDLTPIARRNCIAGSSTTRTCASPKTCAISCRARSAWR